MGCITKPPPELKRSIADMVAAQDAAHKKPLAAGVFNSRINRDFFVRAGSDALFQISCDWSALAAPVVFEVGSA